MNKYDERINELRTKMADAGIDVYFISVSDFHDSEYVAEHFACLKFMSGFTGEAAYMVITGSDAYLFVDGRYYIQAEIEISGSSIILMKMGQPDVPEIDAFLKEKTEGRVLGFDGDVVTAFFGNKFSCEIKSDRDLVGEVWHERPAQLFEPIYELPLETTGQTCESKILRIREELKKSVPEGESYVHIINSLDDIAWIFNLRGNDIECNPVASAWAAISEDEVFLYTASKVPKDSEAYKLAKLGSYSPDCLKLKGYSHVLMDTSRIAFSIYEFYAHEGTNIINIDNPSTLMKAIKNETEIAQLKKALIKDSAVVCNFIYWLKKNVGKIPMTEVSVSDHLEEMRRAQEGFIELSFETIAAYRENAAQMHYAPQADSCKEIQAEGFLLVDSGGQYLEGTTDITRTVAMGPLTDEEKKAFTLTAVSMLRLMNTKFMKGCSGENLDIMAREAMWKEGWDYKCGTGHGVGHVLNVHEGPHSIRWKFNKEHPTALMVPGMVVTDEPGVYREGRFGIRTENELLVKEYKITEDGTFYEFENLTFIPIDIDAIDDVYLSVEDKDMLNKYHRSVYESVGPLLNSDVREWLKECTKEL